ncbi:NAD(P)/FAD-dependent oxidoreductase [Maritimibacter sp. HL-12]|uniref:NAD(P)/FAD-dependent oxidoreductase n=1 Tax=Maritimibacter sp. HL-12 TaxID=1162418 RepID=UPI000A0F2DD6|nr:FAD-dependent oxidoreductase [Maritimibacter sp. HL-12]SMH46371.1 3-phenylpropionate/trans-cinnamate dioxygenase ferredoxin reductase subunit [Maritimibacter sp. HL-12]
MKPIVIVGAGQAGSALAAKLRALGSEAPIRLVGAEPVPPYQRPPLSKKYLLGEVERERLYLRPESFYEDAGIELVTDTRVKALDANTLAVAFEDGASIACSAIALCTGAEPIRLPEAVGGTLGGVFTMRSLSDADALVPAFRAGARVLIVGGGYIGLEAAAVAASRGLEVTLVEMAPRILARVACAETAAWFKALHESHGVEIREGVGLRALVGDGTVRSAILSDGTELPVDLVVVGIGVRPETALAEAAGLAIENGIRVDAFGRTSEPGIFAAGDCASFPWNGGRIRLESVPNAIEQAEAVAATIMGVGAAYVARPWFWSDQYDVKLQIAGLNSGHDAVIVRPGDKPGSVSHWYFAGPRLLAVDAMNDPRAYMTAKRMIEAGQSPMPSAVANPAVPLKSLPTADALLTEQP